MVKERKQNMKNKIMTTGEGELSTPEIKDIPGATPVVCK